MEEVFIEPYITIKLDRQNPSVISDWTGSPTTEQFKEGKQHLLSTAQQHHCLVMVLNYQNMTAYLNLETQVWTIQDWFPRVLQHEVKRIGIVIPSKVVAQIVVKSIFAGFASMIAGKGIELSYFDSVAQLEEWRNSKVGTPTATSYVGSAPARPTPPPPPPMPTVGGVSLNDEPISFKPSIGASNDIIHDDPFA